jgi:hypothetical protein
MSLHMMLEYIELPTYVEDLALTRNDIINFIIPFIAIKIVMIGSVYSTLLDWDNFITFNLDVY